MTSSEQKQIIAELYPICRSVEAEIVGQSDDRLCDWWAYKNAFRHSYSIASIVRHAKSRAESQRLCILNLSGVYPGHQDFSIAGYLSKRLAVRYFAVDHPNSPFLDKAVFVEGIRKFGIEVLLQNLQETTAVDLTRKIGCVPDVVLFTEVAEHLDHSTLLRCMREMSRLVDPSGLILLSTPNADYFNFRMRHLIGRELDYWGDGTNNLDQGLFGHIAYHNIPRLRRLLNDVGLDIQKAITVNFPVSAPHLPWARKAVLAGQRMVVNGLISLGERTWRLPKVMGATKTLGELIHLEIRKSTAKSIPFAL